MLKRIKCNVCGGNNLQFLFYGWDRNYRVDNTRFSIEKCKNCGLVFVNPQPTAEDLSKYYPEEYGAYEHSVRVLKYGPISNFVKNSFLKLKSKKELTPKAEESLDKKDKTVKTLLDLGCGNGHFLEKTRASHPNWKLYGFDNSPFACKIARSKGFEVWEGDFDSADLPKDFFDIIHLSHVVEHLNDPRKTITKIYSLLKKGGKLILIAPNFDSVSAKVFRQYWYALDTPRHLFHFSPKTLGRLLQDLGFKITKVECDSDVRIAIKSLNYLFDRKDRRMNFFVYRFLWAVFQPIGILLAKLKKTSIMTVEGEKI